MSENNRFKLHIEWYNQEKTDGKATLKEMGQPLGVIESIEDARLIRDTLNELYDGNEQLEQQIKLLKLALCEELQDNGNAYSIEIFDDLFGLNYDEWESKHEYPDWEEILKNKKGLKE